MNVFLEAARVVLGLWFVPPALILGSALWTALDSARLGVPFVGSADNRRAAFAWFVSGLVLGPVAVPYYLVRRRQHLAVHHKVCSPDD